MVDLVGTCPQGFWEEWIEEGDAVGAPWSGQEWSWFTRHHSMRRLIRPGDRFYVVACGYLRGWAPVTRVSDVAIHRHGGAVACTICEEIKGFRGLRQRWWRREDELPFPDWRTRRPIVPAPAEAALPLFEAAS